MEVFFLKRLSASLIAIILGVSLSSYPASAAKPDLKMDPSLGQSAADYVPDEINVRFRNDSKPFRTLKVTPGTAIREAARLSKRADVVYAEPNYLAHAAAVPNDPFYFLQWNFRSTETGGIGLESAWDVTDGSGVTVAILDTGIAYEHYGIYAKAPDLATAKFAPGYDFINSDDHPNDDHSHGTHVAGTVAQSTNNSQGAAGAAHGATLMPVKVLAANGSGSYGAIANGIYFAADHGADVINMSLGGSAGSTLLEDALRYAHDKGVTIVAATGNGGSGTVSFPAAYDDYVIAVGATGYGAYLAPYSNTGSSVDLVAPGGDMTADRNGDGYADGILQETLNASAPSTFSYYFFQGTSMATPHVAAAAAMVIASGAATTPEEVQTLLQTSARDLGTPGKDTSFGWGLINVTAALASAEPVNHVPSAADQSLTLDEDTTQTVTLTGADLDGDSLTFSVVTGPSHGSLTGTAPDLTYQPDPNYSGPDSFTFQVFDGADYSATATVSLTINSVNDAPTVSPVAVTTKKNTPITIPLKGTDVDGDDMTYEVTSFVNGKVSIEGSIATFTPNPNYVGKGSFTFTVSDGKLASHATGTVTIKRK